jgi:hypothetical protein
MSASSNDRKAPKGAIALPAVAAAVLFAGRAGAQSQKPSLAAMRRQDRLGSRTEEPRAA